MLRLQEYLGLFCARGLSQSQFNDEAIDDGDDNVVLIINATRLVATTERVLRRITFIQRVSTCHDAEMWENE
jgi:hypothetical protein